MSLLLTKFNEIETYMSMLKTHLTELEGGKKASSAKARASAQSAKTLLQQLRKDVIAHVKALPVKQRKKITPVEPTPVSEPEPVKSTEMTQMTIPDEKKEPRKTKRVRK